MRVEFRAECEQKAGSKRDFRFLFLTERKAIDDSFELQTGPKDLKGGNRTFVFFVRMGNLSRAIFDSEKKRLFLSLFAEGEVLWRTAEFLSGGLSSDSEDSDSYYIERVEHKHWEEVPFTLTRKFFRCVKYMQVCVCVCVKERRKIELTA